MHEYEAFLYLLFLLLLGLLGGLDFLQELQVLLDEQLVLLLLVLELSIVLFLGSEDS